MDKVLYEHHRLLSLADCKLAWCVGLYPYVQWSQGRKTLMATGRLQLDWRWYTGFLLGRLPCLMQLLVPSVLLLLTDDDCKAKRKQFQQHGSSRKSVYSGHSGMYQLICSTNQMKAKLGSYQVNHLDLHWTAHIVPLLSPRWIRWINVVNVKCIEEGLHHSLPHVLWTQKPTISVAWMRKCWCWLDTDLSRV